MAKEILLTRDTAKLSQTIREILDDNSIFQPLDAYYTLKAVERLHFPSSLHFDKVYGRWVFTNMDRDDWCNQRDDITRGHQFAFSDDTPEMATARGVNYYFHLAIDEKCHAR